MGRGGEHKILEVVRSLNLPARDYAIFGSGPLLARGIIDDVNDVDIICRGKAWDIARQLGELVYLDEYDVHVVSIDNQRITIGTSWGIGEFNIDELIDTAEEIDDLPFVRLRYVVEYKKIARRPKDLEHLSRLSDT